MLWRKAKAASVGIFASSRMIWIARTRSSRILLASGIERRERPDGGHEHAHRVGVVAEALHEVLDVLVHEGVDRDLIDPARQLGLDRGAGR